MDYTAGGWSTTETKTITANISMPLTITKATPSCEVPTGLTAAYGDTLSSVTLPEGWAWNNPSSSVGNAGTKSFSAKFTPSDTVNYNTVTKSVSVAVSKIDPSYTIPTGWTAIYGNTLSDVTLPEGWAWDNPSSSVGNAGTNSFSATYTPSDTVNYNTVTENVSLTVSKATPAYTIPTGMTATYGDHLSDVALPSGWVWDNPSASVGNAGSNSFSATFIPSDTDNYENVTQNVSVTVAKATPSYTTPSALTATYGDYLSDVTLPSGWAWDDNTASVGNAGTNSFSATFTPSDTVNYNTVTKSVSIAVSKATPSCTTPTDLTAAYGNTLADVTLPSGWAWDDETASVGNAGTNSFSATFTPSDIDNFKTVTENVSVTVSKIMPLYSVPTGITATYGNTLADVTLPSGWAWDNSSTSVGNAGSHSFSATYTPSDTDNYNKVTKNVSVAVLKATPLYENPKDISAAYGDHLSNVTLPSGWVWDNPTTSVGDIGTHSFSATFTPNDTDNYNKVNKTVSVKVVKARPSYTVPTGLTATYGAHLSDVTLPAGWAWDDPSSSVGNAGINSFSATFTPSDTDNYTTVSLNVSVTVAKATPAYTIPTGITATYGDTLLLVSLPAGWAWDAPFTSVGNAGTNSFSATFTPGDTDNYYTVTKNVSVTVSKIMPLYSVPTGLTATYGDHLSDVSLPAGWAWDNPSSSVGNAGTNSFSATFTPSDMVNYNKVTENVSIAVSKATPAYTIPTGLTATYGDHLSDVTLSEGWAWDNHTTSVGNAGANSFSATYTPSDTDNYNTVTKNIGVTVAKATPSYTIPTGLTATYGAHLSDVALPEGWAWDNASTSVGNAGSHSFSATFTPSDTDNYNKVTKNISLTIAKATPSYTIPTGLTATYGDHLIDVALPEGWAWDNASTSVGNAGANSFSATYTPSDTDNYNTVTKNIGVTVAKATPSYTIPTGLTATYGDYLSDVTLPAGWAWENSTTSVGNAGANSFSATFTPSDMVNYNKVTKNVSIAVSKATPAYTIPTGITATYGNTLSDVSLPEGWSWDAPSTSVGNVGAHSFSATFTPSDKENYNKVTKNVSVTVAKATPAYTIPTGLKATYGDTLSDVTLPAGWAWNTPLTSVGNAGAHSFFATYTPSDKINYNSVNLNTQVEVSAEVTFNTNGGSAIPSSSTASKITKPQDPVKSGYNFSGWYKDQALTAAWNFETDTVTENTTLYAKWTEKPGEKTTTVDCRNGVTVDNLDDIFGDENIVTDEDKGITTSDLSDNNSVDIKVSVTDKTKDNAEKAQDILNASGNKKIGLYFDITVEKIVSKNNHNISTTKLTEVPQLLKFTIPLSKELQGKESYSVFRNHNGQIDELTITPNADGEYIKLSGDGKSIMIFVKKFSTYAIGFTEKTAKATPVKLPERNPKTGNNIPVSLLIFSGLCFGAIVYTKKKKQK